MASKLAVTALTSLMHSGGHALNTYSGVLCKRMVKYLATSVKTQAEHVVPKLCFVASDTGNQRGGIWHMFSNSGSLTWRYVCNQSCPNFERSRTLNITARDMQASPACEAATCVPVEIMPDFLGYRKGLFESQAPVRSQNVMEDGELREVGGRRVTEHQLAWDEQITERQLARELADDQSTRLSHVDGQGRARMVDTGAKPLTNRVAVAAGRVLLGCKAFELVERNKIAKGDVLTVANIAGINGAKLTSNLVPLCHAIALSSVEVDLRLDREGQAVEITATARATGPTGVEMEALTAVTVAGLTIYDMCKAVSKQIEITDVRLLEKVGGKSGHWLRSRTEGAR